MDRWLLNGEPADTIRIEDRGLAYGDGLFETVAVRKGQPRLFAYHLERLVEGCPRLGIPAPARESLKADAERNIGAGQHGVLKIIVTRGSGPRGYTPPAAASPTVLIGYAETAEDSYAEALEVAISDIPLSENPALAGMKTLNRLDSVLARAALTDSDCEEAIMLNHRGDAVCGTMSNIFIVAAGELLTPDLSAAGVAGVMRRRVLEIAGELGIKVAVRTINKSELLAADALLLTNSLWGMRVARRCASTHFVAEPLVEQLRHALAAAGIEECA